jgi:glucose-6-phosphate isomerase
MKKEVNMPCQPLNELSEATALTKQAQIMNHPENHLKNLVVKKDRLNNFSLNQAGLFYDFSRQRVDETTMNLLFNLAEKRKLNQNFNAMVSGENVNTSENRAALHTATRNASNDPVYVDGKDIMPEIKRVNCNIKTFVSDVHSGKIKGSTGKMFKHIVVIGIGGSYLGTEFIASALCTYAVEHIKLHFLSNIDIDNFGSIVSAIDPETTLWIVISKSFTTAETLANMKQAHALMKDKGLDPSKHVVTVTSKGSPGDNASGDTITSFHMFDFIGGRYSVTSAVGGVPLGLYLGYDMFERILKGANEMDIHAAHAQITENIPMVAALISIWNRVFLKYPSNAIIPYASVLSKLAPHIQQLSMESLGKGVTKDGELIDYPTGAIIFGEPGTNAQHSFLQLAHQGQPFPIDFIGVIQPLHLQYKETSKGVTNHQELWANMLSQARAMAVGKQDNNKTKYFSGNRPSSTLVLTHISPENIGRLLAFYEAKTVFEAFILGINPFDQFGVELGKTMASEIRNEITEKNNHPKYNFIKLDDITNFYLTRLFEKTL